MFTAAVDGVAGLEVTGVTVAEELDKAAVGLRNMGASIIYQVNLLLMRFSLLVVFYRTLTTP